MSPKRWFRLLGLSCLLVVAGFMVPALTDDAKKGKKVALLVGVTEYDSSKLAPLTYTENDVVELGKLLRGKTAGFDSVRVLTNKGGKSDKPTAANIRAALKELIQKRTRHDTILIALSGHGLQLEVRDPKEKLKPNVYSYFCPTDTDLAAEVSHSTGKSASLLQVREVLDALDDCGAGTKLLLMDACRNELKALATTRSLDVRQFSIPENSAALFSCKPGQKAFETPQLKHGVFFHFVLDGLRGKAKNKRGEVTWSRLAEYVQENVNDTVEKIVGGGAKQEPHFVNNLAGKSPVLARLDAKEEEPKKDKDGGTKVVDAPKDKNGKEEIVKGFLDKDGKNSIGMKFVLVKKGKFTMGSPKDEKRREASETEHEVEITKDFYLGVYEVTQKQYKSVMGKNPSAFCAAGIGEYKVKGMNTDDFPVERVSWKDAQDFLGKLNELPAEKAKGRKYRLPTEAEWEYACRAGVSSQKYHTGDDISKKDANLNDSFLGRTTKVGSYAANKFGLYDMHGNVNEWCEDWYGEKYYEKSPARDPLNLDAGTHSHRVYRGGSWYWATGSGTCRSAYRGRDRPVTRSDDRGFRAALDPAR